MDWLLVILRLLHIVAAFAWVGLGATLAFFVLPAAQVAGDSGLRFLKSMFTTTPFARLFPIVSGVTMLAGLIMYALGSPSHFSSTGNMVLGIGAVAGMIAGVHGGAVTGRATTALAKALAENVSDDGKALSADVVATLRSLIAKLSGDARISFVMMAVALIGMGTARYL